jgi:hypothetical protein
MTELVELYKKLEQYSHFEEDEENWEHFVDTFDAIVSKGDPASIPELLKYLDDQCEYDYVQGHLIRALETFSDEVYVISIIKNICNLLVKSSYLCVDIIKRILNNNNCLSIFRENMHLADKESLLKLFKIMEEESPHHRELIRELRAEIENSPKE